MRVLLVLLRFLCVALWCDVVRRLVVFCVALSFGVSCCGALRCISCALLCFGVFAVSSVMFVLIPVWCMRDMLCRFVSRMYRVVVWRVVSLCLGVTLLLDVPLLFCVVLVCGVLCSVGLLCCVWCCRCVFCVVYCVCVAFIIMFALFDSLCVAVLVCIASSCVLF